MGQASLSALRNAWTASGRGRKGPLAGPRAAALDQLIDPEDDRRHQRRGRGKEVKAVFPKWGTESSVPPFI